MEKFIPHFVIWGCLTIIVILLAIYRRRVDLKADDMLHVLDSEMPIANSQQVVAKKIESIDRWGKILTVIVALYALFIAGWYVWGIFSDTSVKIG